MSCSRRVCNKEIQTPQVTEGDVTGISKQHKVQVALCTYYVFLGSDAFKRCSTLISAQATSEYLSTFLFSQQHVCLP